MSPAAMSLWEQAIARLPRPIKWVHHGRDPKVGLDCIGLVLCVYSLRNIDVTDLDVPYGVRDALTWRRAGVIYQRMLWKFDPVPLDAVIEGDVLVSRRGGEGHVAVAAGRNVYQMTAKGLWCSPLPTALLTTERAFRYRE